MRTLLLPLLLIVLFSCDQTDNFPKAAPAGSGSSLTTLPSNTLSFSADNWRSYVGEAGNQGNPNHYIHTRVTGSSRTSPSTPVSGTGLGGLPAQATSYTLGMAASTILDTASYSYWAYRFFPPTSLRVGQSITLRAKVRLDQVQGKGISLVLRGDRSSQPALLFASTEGKTPLKGTSAFTEYAVTLPYSTSVDYLLVYFVLLPNTTGTAQFTDVSVAIQ